MICGMKLPLIGLSILLLGCGNNKGKPEIQKDGVKNTFMVEVYQVDAGTYGNKLNYSGTIVPKVSTPLSFLLPGTVVSVNAEEGDHVQKGQVLAALNSVSQTNTYNGTLAALNQAKDAYDRLKSVYDKGSLPEIQMQDAISKLEQAKSANQVALRNLENCTLKAPKDGFIGIRNIEVGATSVPGVPVFNLVLLNEVYVRISVPENEINDIQQGLEVSVTIPALGSKVFMGEVEKIGVIANMLTKTYEVKVIVKNPDLLIKSGMACDATIKTKPEQQELTIPYKSVLKDEKGNAFVFKMDGNTEKTVKVFVELGGFSGNEVEILSGLESGDVIVTEGQHKLTEGNVVSSSSQPKM